MNSDYRNDRNLFGHRDEGSEKESSPRMSPASSRQHIYGRDNASMRGNDFYGTQSYGKDYSRGDFSTSTFGSGRAGWASKRGGYAVRQPERMESKYVEFPDYSNRPTYGSYAGSRAYTDFINYNYGYSQYESTEPRSYKVEGKEKAPSRYDRRATSSGVRTRFRSANQANYSENDGRRR